jgi:hypothetical protein
MLPLKDILTEYLKKDVINHNSYQSIDSKHSTVNEHRPVGLSIKTENKPRETHNDMKPPLLPQVKTEIKPKELMEI